MTKLQELQAKKTQLEKEILELEKQMIPKPKPEINWSPVLESATSYVKEIVDNDGYVDSDTTHYMYETVMETVFGKDVWDWIRANEK